MSNFEEDKNLFIPKSPLFRQLTQNKWDVAKKIINDTKNVTMNVAIHYDISGKKTYHLIQSNGTTITFKV